MAFSGFDKIQWVLGPTDFLVNAVGITSTDPITELNGELDSDWEIANDGATHGVVHDPFSKGWLFVTTRPPDLGGTYSYSSASPAQTAAEMNVIIERISVAPERRSSLYSGQFFFGQPLGDLYYGTYKSAGTVMDKYFYGYSPYAPFAVPAPGATDGIEYLPYPPDVRLPWDARTDLATVFGFPGGDPSAAPTFVNDLLIQSGSYIRVTIQFIGPTDPPLTSNYAIDFLGQGFYTDPRFPGEQFGRKFGLHTHQTKPILYHRSDAGGRVTLHKTLLVPVLDADSVSGRISLALGKVDYEQVWNVLPAGARSSGNSVASLYGLGKVTGYPVLFTSSGQGHPAGEMAQGLPWTTGTEATEAPADGHYRLPQALFALPQEGLTRLSFQDTLLSPAEGSGTPASVRVWRETKDQGGTWADAPAPDPFPYAAYFAEGARRGERRISGPLLELPVLPAFGGVSMTPSDPRRVMEGGAAGFIYSRGQWRGATGLPPFLAYGASGAYAAISRPPGPFQPFVSLTSKDGAKTFALETATPSRGGHSGDFVAVPGYPFPAQVQSGLFGPLSGLSVQERPMPFSAAGGSAWARGSDHAGSLYLFQPFIQRLPIPRQSFNWNGVDLNGAFLDDTDAEVAGVSGRDWGTRTGIGWTYTGDGGTSWGPVGCVTVDGDPLIVEAETARIAAVRTKAGGILLCVCAGGRASLYVSGSGAADFALLGYSLDGGRNWNEDLT